jgi:hypothetical protein
MENVLPIEGRQINPYLERLTAALEALEKGLREAGEEDVADYCRQIGDTLVFFRYSDEDQKEGIDSRLRIDPSTSGFPNSLEFIRLFQEKNRAGEVLAGLPTQEQLAGSAMQKILAGDFPLQEQQSKVRLDYYRRLRDIPIVRDFEVVRVRENGSGDGFRHYHLHWRGLDQSKNLFIAYSLDLEQDKGDEALGRKHGSFELFTALEQKFGLGAAHLLKSVDAFAAIHPKAVKRHVIGPFYCDLTHNAGPLEDVFRISADPWLLRYRCESVVSEKTLEIKKSMFRKPDRMELCSDETAENFAYCPNRIRQELGEMFLNGGEESYRVVGVDQEGQIID